MEPVFAAICYTFIAGIMNGSFALFTKNTQEWKFENIWLSYAFWAFLALPWIVAIFLGGNIWSIYNATPANTLFILIIGGILFGTGQICFALALNMIGLGLGFVINLGFGTGLGLLLPLIFLHSDKIFSAFGLVTLLGFVFIVIGLLISYRAGRLRERQNLSSSKNHYLVGVLLAMAAGVFSAGQNFTFALTQNVQQNALNMGAGSLEAATIIWPLFLSFAFLPYAIYMIYLHTKNNSFQAYKSHYTSRNIYRALVMGIFWYGSLVLYSKASLLIGDLGPVVAWPLFMVLIILTSNFWGWRHKEWAGAPQNAKRDALLAIAILIIAVVILAYGTTLR